MRLTRLRYWREQGLMTQQELADKAGISRSAISMIESLIVEPQLSTIRKLAAALERDWHDLVDEPPPPS